MLSLLAYLAQASRQHVRRAKGRGCLFGLGNTPLMIEWPVEFRKKSRSHFFTRLSFPTPIGSCPNLLKQPYNRVRLFIAGLAVCLNVADSTRAAEVSIAWDPPSPSNSVVGYKVYYGFASRDYTTSVDAGNMTTCTIDGLSPSITYYFAITAYNSSSNESGYSSELVWDNVPPTISAPDEIELLEDPSQLVLMPDLRQHITVIDDVSPNSGIVISQEPTPGTKLLNDQSWVSFAAKDEAGNSSGRIVTLAYEPDDNGPDDSASSSIGISLVDGNPVVSCSIPAPSGISPSTSGSTFTLEWCTNLCTRQWTPVPGYESVLASSENMAYIPATEIRAAFFRIQRHLE